MDALRGITLTKKDFVENVTIHWKQGAILGVGGDRSQSYDIFNYETPNGGLVPVYIQSGYEKPQELKIDGRLQYGMNDGVFFLVFHDKSQTPYQHRFIQNQTQKQLYNANALLKTYTGGMADFSWIAGDYLRNFK